MKENFWSTLPRPFYSGTYGRRDRYCLWHVVSEAARPDVFLLNLPILRVTATLKVFIVCADA